MLHLTNQSTRLIFPLLLVFSFCGCEKEAPQAPRSFRYAGLGMVSDFLIGTHGFTAKHLVQEGRESTIKATGGVQNLPNGFKKLVVGNVEGATSLRVGKEIYGIEVPGLFTLFQPVFPEQAQWTLLASPGKCPDNDFQMSWVDNFRDYDGLENNINEGVGIAKLSQGLKKMSVQGLDLPFSKVCSRDAQEVFDDPNLASEPAVVFNPNGVLIGRLGKGNEIFGMELKSFSMKELKDKSFFGFMYDQSSVGLPIMEPLWLRFNRAGNSAIAGGWEDFELDAKSPPEVHFLTKQGQLQSQVFLQLESSKIFKETSFSKMAESQIICNFDSQFAGSNRDLISCLGRSSEKESYNLLLISAFND